MGCGRSSLGSDSPKKNKKNEGDSECDSDGDSSSSGGGGGAASRKQQQLSNKLVALGAGGPLLAQARISESQQDFFMMLDEKIENGPDYDSETEEMERRRRLRQCAQQWGTLSSSQPGSPNNGNPIRLPDEDTGGSGDITEDEEEEEEEEPGRIPDEAVREQYMFMGNLYTLTHIRTDSDKTEPKVDVVEVQEAVEDPGVGDVEFGHKLNGSAVQEENGVMEEATVADGKPQPKSSPRSTSRPASLILRSVFPADTVQE